MLGKCTGLEDPAPTLPSQRDINLFLFGCFLEAFAQYLDNCKAYFRPFTDQPLKTFLVNAQGAHVSSCDQCCHTRLTIDDRHLPHILAGSSARRLYIMSLFYDHHTNLA